MFSEIDKSDDNRISVDEFKQALPDIKRWGVTIEDPDKAFAEVDSDGGGLVLFDEFADWALRKQLDLEARGTAMPFQTRVERDLTPAPAVRRRWTTTTSSPSTRPETSPATTSVRRRAPGPGRPVPRQS